MTVVLLLKWHSSHPDIKRELDLQATAIKQSFEAEIARQEREWSEWHHKLQKLHGRITQAQYNATRKAKERGELEEGAGGAELVPPERLAPPGQVLPFAAAPESDEEARSRMRRELGKTGRG